MTSVKGPLLVAGALSDAGKSDPVLLEPGSDPRSHVVLRGRPLTDVSATNYRELQRRLKAAAREAYEELAARFDVVICEGPVARPRSTCAAAGPAARHARAVRPPATIVIGTVAGLETSRMTLNPEKGSVWTRGRSRRDAHS